MDASKGALRSLGVGRLIGIGAVFAIILGAIVAMPALVSAADGGQESAGRAVFAQADGERDGSFKGRFGFRGARGVAGNPVAVTAELTGTETSDVIAALRDGASLVSYAAEYGVSEADLADAVIGNAEENLAERVASGDMTQEEADEKLAGLQERLPEMLNAEGFGPAHNCNDLDDSDDSDDSDEETTSNTV